MLLRFSIFTIRALRWLTLVVARKINAAQHTC